MSSINGDYIKVDGVTIDSVAGVLRQVPGTDGGGSGAGNFIEQQVSLALTFADKYVDIALVPSDLSSVELYVLDSLNYQGPLQIRVKDFSVVLDAVSGDRKRISWDNTSVPGSSTAIPDSGDSAPTEGLQDILVSSDSFLIKYVV